MAYLYLPQDLVYVADAVRKYFEHHRGVSGFRIETAIADGVRYVPTLQGKSSDNYIVCVEVAEKYEPLLDSVVLQCVDSALPVKLYLAIPKGVSAEEYRSILSSAKKGGVGVLEVSESGNVVLQADAVALTLLGVQKIDHSKYPKKYRENLSKAANVYGNGEASKACSIIYDEIEGLTRALATKIRALGLLNGCASIDFSKDHWSKVVKAIINHREKSDPRLSAMSEALLSRIHGITEYRNQSGHKVNNRKALVKRDRELRTRFESAANILLELLGACRPLGIR